MGVRRGVPISEMSELAQLEIKHDDPREYHPINKTEIPIQIM